MEARSTLRYLTGLWVLVSLPFIGCAQFQHKLPEALPLWLSPMRYKGMPVYIGQISRDIGVKLTTKSPTLTTHEVDPDVDEARDYLMQDLLGSQKVAKLGFVEGVGSATPDNPRYNLTDSPYWTDGFRVVFEFTETQTALDEVEVFDWKRLYQKYK